MLCHSRLTSYSYVDHFETAGSSYQFQKSVSLVRPPWTAWCRTLRWFRDCSRGPPWSCQCRCPQSWVCCHLCWEWSQSSSPSVSPEPKGLSDSGSEPCPGPEKVECKCVFGHVHLIQLEPISLFFKWMVENIIYKFGRFSKNSLSPVCQTQTMHHLYFKHVLPAGPISMF